MIRITTNLTSFQTLPTFNSFLSLVYHPLLSPTKPIPPTPISFNYLELFLHTHTSAKYLYYFLVFDRSCIKFNFQKANLKKSNTPSPHVRQTPQIYRPLIHQDHFVSINHLLYPLLYPTDLPSSTSSRYTPSHQLPKAALLPLHNTPNSKPQ